MKAKAERAIKHCIKKADIWAIEAIENYIDLCEKQAFEAQMEVMSEYSLERRSKKILDMCGVYVHSFITERVVNFLYNNIEELREKNKKTSLTQMLFKLQILFDQLDTYSQMYNCERIIATPGDIKKLQKEINKIHKQQMGA